MTSGRTKVLTEDDASRVVAIACSDPPKGRSAWTLQLIAEHAVSTRAVPAIGKQAVRLILKSHGLKPWLKKMGCVPNLDRPYVKRMNDVLEAYPRPFYRRNPVVCIDEKPTQLLDAYRSGYRTRTAIRREDYAYKRNGTAALFCCVEPKAGRHLISTRPCRTGAEFAKFMNRVQRAYKSARKIHCIMNNLNTHRERSLTDFYGEVQGRKIWRRFIIYHTPKHASWLNQAEIQIGLITRECLRRRRMPTLTKLRAEVAAWSASANRKKRTINWTFTKRDARKRCLNSTNIKRSKHRLSGILM